MRRRMMILMGAAVVTGLFFGGETKSRGQEKEGEATMEVEEWRKDFEEAMSLKEGENLKYLPPGKLADRKRYFLEVEKDKSPMPFVQWRWVKGKLKREMMSAAGPKGVQLGAVLSCCAKLDAHHGLIEKVDPINADGDWIVRDGASTEAILADLVTILKEQFGRNVRTEKGENKVDALVMTGEYHFKALEGEDADDLQIFADVLDHPKPGESIMGGGKTEPGYLWTYLGEAFGMPLIDETTGEPAKISWELSFSIRGANKDGEKRDLILKNISEQTGVKFKEEKRTMEVWRFVGVEE